MKGTTEGFFDTLEPWIDLSTSRTTFPVPNNGAITLQKCPLIGS